MPIQRYRPRRLPASRADVPARAGADAHGKFAVPSIKRRLICMVYESLLLAGVAFLSGLLFLVATGPNPGGWTRHAFQIYLGSGDGILPQELLMFNQLDWQNKGIAFGFVITRLWNF